MLTPLHLKTMPAEAVTFSYLTFKDGGCLVHSQGPGPPPLIPFSSLMKRVPHHLGFSSLSLSWPGPAGRSVPFLKYSGALTFPTMVGKQWLGRQ